MVADGNLSVVAVTLVGSHARRGEMKKRFSYRAYPDADQRAMLAKTFGCARVVYNDFVAYCRDSYEKRGVIPDLNEVKSIVTAQAKRTPERQWLAEVSSVPLQEAARDAQSGYRAFFMSIAGTRRGPRVNPPRMKRKSGRQVATFTTKAFTVRADGCSRWGFVRLAKIGEVKFRLSRPLPSCPSTVKVICEPSGEYRVSFVVEVEAACPAAVESVAGVDLGLAHLAIVAGSSGERYRVPNQRNLRSVEHKLAKAQRRLSRKEKGGRNRDKARIGVARLHARVARSRKDQLHNVARRLVDENQVIAVENLDVVALGKTRFAKSIADAGWGILLGLLRSKARESGREVVVIDRWFPSTQMCSQCGRVDGPKPLRIRIWKCECGAVLDRDYNAAVNIMLAAGLAESLNAHGGVVRRVLALADPSELGTHLADARASA